MICTKLGIEQFFANIAKANPPCIRHLINLVLGRLFMLSLGR